MFVDLSYGQRSYQNKRARFTRVKRTFEDKKIFVQ